MIGRLELTHSGRTRLTRGYNRERLRLLPDQVGSIIHAAGAFIQQTARHKVFASPHGQFDHTGAIF